MAVPTGVTLAEQDLHIAVADFLAVALPPEAVLYRPANGEWPCRVIRAC